MHDKAIRNNLIICASRRHVPALIFQCPDYPRTQNGTKSESCVSNIPNHYRGLLPQLEAL